MVRICLLGLVCLLAACTTTTPKPDLQTPATDEAESRTLESAPQPGPPAEPIAPPADAPSRTIFSGGRELMLVRAMEGGACNASDQGARGLFLIYADPQGIRRIETEKSSGVFERLEAEIQQMSLKAFQQAVHRSHISPSPFALDQNDAINSVTGEIRMYFEQALESPVADFERRNNLAIRIIPFEHSFDLYSSDCTSSLEDAEPPRN